MKSMYEMMQSIQELPHYLIPKLDQQNGVC